MEINELVDELEKITKDELNRNKNFTLEDFDIINKKKMLILYDEINMKYKSPFKFVEKNVSDFDVYFKENNDYKKLAIEWEEAYKNNDINSLIKIKEIYSNSYKNFMKKQYGLSVKTDFIVGYSTGKPYDIGKQLSKDSLYRKAVESMPDYDGKIEYTFSENVKGMYSIDYNINIINLSLIKTFDEYYSKQKHETISHVTDGNIHKIYKDIEKIKNVVKNNDLDDYRRIIHLGLLHEPNSEDSIDYFLYFMSPWEKVARHAEGRK